MTILEVANFTKEGRLLLSLKGNKTELTEKCINVSKEFRDKIRQAAEMMFVEREWKAQSKDIAHDPKQYYFTC